MSSINFDNVWLLFLALPLAVLFSVPYALAIRKSNINGHNIASQAIHILLAVAVAFAAAGTSIRTVLTETNVYVVADVSYSANKNLDTIDAYIAGLKLPANSKMGLVCFGKDCEIVSNMGDPSAVGSVKDASVDTSETDIAGALTFAGELFRDDVIKRIVLITDGKQTDERDDYAITRAVDGLEAKNVRVDAVYLDDNISSDAKEVQITGVEYTKGTFTEREETALVSVQSSFATNAVVTLTRGGEEAGTRAVELSAGVNVIDFDLYTDEKGEYDYEARVEAEGDGSGYNNACSFTQKVSEELKVLYITQSWADACAAIEQYDDRAELEIYEYDTSVTRIAKTRYLSSAARENLNVHLLDRNIPIDIEDLCGYDEFVLADVDLTKFYGYTQFVNNLDIGVSAFGKTLMTFGNLYIQTSDDEAQAWLEDMLPVRFGNHGQEPRLYTIVIDSSRSMEQLYHLAIAKQLSVRLLDLLNDDDEVCVVTFNGDVQVVRSPTKLTSGNRQSIINAINGLEVVQGTVIGKGLQTAYDYIAPLRYSDKQVMLISDGLNYMAGSDDPADIAAQMYADGIVTSVFDVGRQGDDRYGNNTDAAAYTAKSLLRRIADNSHGHGNYYYSNNLERLDEVTFGNIADRVTVTVVEQDTPVRIKRRTDSVLEGIDVTAIPQVSGYVYGGTKPSATTVLTMEYGTAKNEVPLYAYWNYGSGRVASFTSKAGEGWTKYWEESGFESAFLANVFADNLPQEKTEVPYALSVEGQGASCRVTLTPAVYRYDAAATVHVKTPSGEEFTELMSYANGSYFLEFDSGDTGKYAVEASYAYEDELFASSAAYHLSYPSEYDAFSAFDPSALYRSLNGRGTVSLDGTFTVENDENVASYRFDLTIPLLIFIVALYLVDIAVRKLKWEDIRSFFGFGNRAKGGKR